MIILSLVIFIFEKLFLCLNVGQYLRPTTRHLSVVEYISPEKFEWYKQQGENMGFKYVASGPLVRSSYKAGEYFMEHMIKSK